MDVYIRLTGLYEIWRNPQGAKSLKASEEKELIRFGLVKNDIVASSIIANAGDCAKFIEKTFHYPCITKDVTNWQRGRYLPPGARPFPLKDVNGRFNSLEVEAWGKENLPQNGEVKGRVSSGDYRQRRDAALARLAEVEADNAERKQSDLWMLTGVHLFEMSAFGAVVKATAQDIIERQLNRPDLFDQFQAELGRRVDELIDEAKKSNAEQKAAMK